MSKNAIFTDSQLQKIITHVQNHPKILSSSDYLKINRSISYMTFIMKEIYEYCTQKYDGIYLNSLRRTKLDVKNLKTVLDFHKKYLK
jgi:hypothetical protein